MKLSEILRERVRKWKPIKLIELAGWANVAEEHEDKLHNINESFLLERTKINQLEAENEALMGFIAIILCWKPEWAQTSYFKELSKNLRNDLVELAKSTKHEGSGGIDDEWLDALLTGED